MTTPGQPDKPGWLRWAMLSSLALNLMLASALIAFAVRADRHRSSPRDEDATFQRGPWQGVLRGELRDQRRHWQPEIAKARQARLAVAGALRAEPFDPVALDAALSALREADGRVQLRTQASLSELATRLDADQRARLARRIERTVPPRHR